MNRRDAAEFARELFARIATQPGVLSVNPEGELWIELLCSRAPLADEEAESLRQASRNLAARCRVAATEAVSRLPSPDAASNARDALLAIHHAMDRKEWGADTLHEVAVILTDAGLRPREPDHPVLRYECPECGSDDVELSFPVWVKANDIDDRELWQLDVEAQPEKDGDKGFCPRCGTHVLVRQVEVEHGS